MSDKIFDLLTQEKDLNLQDYVYCFDDSAIYEHICFKINYLRHDYKSYADSHPNANFANDDIIRSYYQRLRLITPPFILERM